MKWLTLAFFLIVDLRSEEIFSIRVDSSIQLSYQNLIYLPFQKPMRTFSSQDIYELDIFPDSEYIS